MDTVLYIIAGPLFIISLGAHFYVRLRFKPEYDSDLDDYYHEFEHEHPGYAKYLKWSKITFSSAALAALLLFLAAAL